MAKKKKMDLSYYDKYKEILESIKEDNVRILEGKQLNIDGSAKRKQDTLQFVESNLKYPLRYYQKEALFVFEDLAYYTPDTVPYKKELLEQVNDKRVGFYTFEMATGSGKTLLMGATILDLYKNKGIKHFLIISPNTTLNEKTIKNFQDPKFSNKTVWNDRLSVKINVVTSDNYQQQQDMFYHEDADLNIYIFNISKFFEVGGKTSEESMKGQPYVKRPIETSPWKDEFGNTISFMEYLRQQELAIITDEAHHYQNINIEGIRGNKSSFDVIKELQPQIVLEFTATAVENITNKRMQKIIYKYSIKDFIEDGFSKKIRAIGMKNDAVDISSENELTDFEKQKIILGMFIHIIKKKALSNSIKPLLFIKCKANTEYENKVYDYITKSLLKDDKNILSIIEKIKIENTTMTLLIREYLEEINYNLDEIKKFFEPLCLSKNVLKYDGETKETRDTKILYDNIETNNIETVVYMKILDEGIDFDNIYTIVVLHDVKSNIKTSVRQIIGRGVRLFRNKRIYDNSKDMLKKQSEILYIVCDKNKNFEEVIEEIRQEIGLGKDSLSFEGTPEIVINEINKDLLKNKELPHIKVKVLRKAEVSFLTEMKKTKEIIDNYFSPDYGVVVYSDSKYVLNNLPESLIAEGEVYSETTRKKIEEKSGHQLKFNFDSNLSKDIYSRIISSNKLPILPSNPKIIEIFDKYIEEMKNRDLHFNFIEELDIRSAREYLITTFSYFYINHMNKRLFTFKYELNDVFRLEDIFKNNLIVLNKDEKGNYINLVSKEVIDSNYESFNKKEIKSLYIMGYKYSIHKYNSFDSNPEKYIADFLDELIDENGSVDDFWIRNQRNFYLEYNMNKYYPDFILYHKGQYFIIEVKGENLMEDFMNPEKKLGAFRKLNEFDNVSCYVIKGNDAKVIKDNCKAIEDLNNYNQM